MKQFLLGIVFIAIFGAALQAFGAQSTIYPYTSPLQSNKNVAGKNNFNSVRDDANTDIQAIRNAQQAMNTELYAADLLKADKSCFDDASAFNACFGLDWATGGTFDQAGNYTLTGSWDFTGAIVTGVSSTPTVASADTLGGIKVGSRLTITDGVLSADVQSGNVPEGTENQIPVYGATGSLGAVTPLTPVAGANITITPNTTAKTLTIAATSPTGATVPSAGIVTSNGTILSSTVPGTGILAALAAPVDGAGGLASKESVDAVSVGSPVVIAPTYSDSACTAGQYAFSVSPSIYWCKANNTWDYQVVSGSSLVWAGWNNPTPAPITGVSDDFSSDCSTTTCTSYTAINGGITVSGGTAGGATGWARNFVYHETSLESANQDVSASVTYNGSSDSAGVIFRVNPVATPTGYMAVFASGKVSLYSFSGTTRTFIDSSTYASYTAGTYTLRATSNGTTIKLYVDGTERLSITNSAYTEGNFCGLAFMRDSSNVDVRADSFFGAAL